MSYFKAKNVQNAISSGAEPQTPLGSLQLTLPYMTPQLAFSRNMPAPSDATGPPTLRYRV